MKAMFLKAKRLSLLGGLLVLAHTGAADTTISCAEIFGAFGAVEERRNGTIANGQISSTITLRTGWGPKTVYYLQEAGYWSSFTTLAKIKTLLSLKYAAVATGWEVDGETLTCPRPSSTSYEKGLVICHEPYTYDVVFDSNGGSGTTTGISGLSYTNATTTLTENGFTRTGYTFAGWAKTATGDKAYGDQDTVGGEKFGVTSDGQEIKLYAKWNPITYAVSYKEDGGTLGSSAPTSATYDSAFSVSAPTKTGYTFNGWTVSGYNSDTAKWGTEDSCSDKVADVGGKVTTSGIAYFKNLASDANATVTLTAQWTAIKTKVTFSREGGTGGTGSIDSIAYGTSKDGYATIEPPTKVGATFQGYYTATNGGGTQYFDKDGYLIRDWDITKTEVTLYANWSADTYTVAFDANGGSGTITDMSVTYSQSFALPSGDELTPSSVRYSFAGWTRSENGAVEFSTGSKTSVKDNSNFVTSGKLTFYAVWKDNQVSVSAVVGSDETVSPSKFSVIPGQPYGTLPTVTTKSYKKAFAGWFTEPTDGVQVFETDIVPTPAPSAIYAHWTNTWYTIRFNGNNNTSGSMDDQTVEFSVATNLSANAFQRTGYTFAGWATTATATSTNYADKASITPDLASSANEVVNLYAVWTANTYYVEFAPNGGSGTMPTLTNRYGVAFALPSCAFTAPAFSTFGGWRDAANAKTYADGETVKNLTADDGATVTLTAIWNSALSDLSRAMHCTNLVWKNVDGYLAATNPWKVSEGADVGHNTGSCAKQTNASVGDQYTLTVSLGARPHGTLSFWWKPTGAATKLYFSVGAESGGIDAPPKTLTAQTGVWTNVVWRIDDPLADNPTAPLSAEVFVNLMNGSNSTADGACLIDGMTWTPGAAEEHPEPTDADAVTISGLTATDGGFTLSYTGDGKFAYRVLYTDSLASPISWLPYGSLTNDTGASGSQTFSLDRDASVPMRFFKVETIRRP